MTSELKTLIAAERKAWNTMMRGSEDDARTAYGEEGKNFVAWCAAADAERVYRALMRPLQAIALVDGDGGISLSHLFSLDRRAEWQSELDALTEKLARKGATHSMRLIDVVITPVEPT